MFAYFEDESQLTEYLVLIMKFRMVRFTLLFNVHIPKDYISQAQFID